MKRPIVILTVPNVGQECLAYTNSVFDFKYVPISHSDKENQEFSLEFFDIFDKYLNKSCDFIVSDVSIELCNKLKNVGIQYVVIIPYHSIDNANQYKSSEETDEEYINKLNEINRFCFNFGYSLIFLNHPDSHMNSSKYLRDVIPGVVDLHVGTIYRELR